MKNEVPRMSTIELLDQLADYIDGYYYDLHHGVIEELKRRFMGD
jgi:hypothetical protein